MTDLYSFISGAVTMNFLLAGLFFARSWKMTKDSLFLAFSAAFGLLGLNQALISLAGIPVEERSWIYVLRLFAFVLIFAAIWKKNRRA